MIKLTSCVLFFYISVSIFQTTKEDDVGSRPIMSRFHATRMKREVSQDAIIFPEEKEAFDSDCEPSQRRKHQVASRFAEPCPNNTLFCEVADEYPIDQIKNLLKQQPKVLQHFYTEDELEPEVTDKFGDDEDTPLCASRTRLIYPKKAKSSENVFEFVVNDDEHRQGVRVEECLHNGNDCDVIGSILPFGYKSHCVQKYVTRSLVIAESSSGSISGIVTKPFKIPSCCACALIVDHSMGDRFGGQFEINSSTESPKNNATRATTTAPLKGLKQN